MQPINCIQGKNYLRYIVKLSDGNIVEFSDNTRTSRKEHWVICIPTQIGCPVGCFMCGSWQIPFKRSLKFEEMKELAEYAIKQQSLKPADSKNFYISFLGIGEPAHNLQQVGQVIKYFHDKYGCKMVISSVGIADNCMELLQLVSYCKIGLQFSLLGFTDQERQFSVKPHQHLLSLTQIADIGVEYFNSTGNKCYLDFLIKENHNGKIPICVDSLSRIFSPKDYFHFSVNVGAQLGNSPNYKPPQSEVADKLFSALIMAGFESSYHRPLGVDNGCGIINQTIH